MSKVGVAAIGNAVAIKNVHCDIHVEKHSRYLFLSGNIFEPFGLSYSLQFDMAEKYYLTRHI